jgi:hypothetical protein
MGEGARLVSDVVPMSKVSIRLAASSILSKSTLAPELVPVLDVASLAMALLSWNGGF